MASKLALAYVEVAIEKSSKASFQTTLEKRKLTKEDRIKQELKKETTEANETNQWMNKQKVTMSEMSKKEEWHVLCLDSDGKNE